MSIQKGNPRVMSQHVNVWASPWRVCVNERWDSDLTPGVADSHHTVHDFLSSVSV